MNAIGRKTFWFISQLVVLTFCIWHMRFIYEADILPEKIVKENYLHTTCTLIKKQLTTQQDDLYRADFLVSYTVNGIPYKNWTSNEVDRSFTHDAGFQQAILGQFHVGENYPCRYHPTSPEIVVLGVRHWSLTLSLFIPFVIALITLYYLIQTIVELTEMVIHWRRGDQ